MIHRMYKPDKMASSIKLTNLFTNQSITIKGVKHTDVHLGDGNKSMSMLASCIPAWV
jgi:hypothetical protein